MQQLERREGSPSVEPQNGTEFTLRWHHHDTKLADTMTRAWEKRLFLDVTLASGNRTIGAHRLVLCACSGLLENLLTSPTHPSHSHANPMLYFNDIEFEDLVALVEFMYRGSMTVTHQSLPSIIHAAQILKVRGLSRDIDEPVDSPPESSGSSEPPVMEPGEPTRKRVRKEVDEHDAKEDGSAEEQEGGRTVENPNPQLAAFISAWAQQTPISSKSVKPTSSAGPSPGLRSRLVWDPAHIVYLENWYGHETRYPNLGQCQLYANQLSQVPQTDQSGKSRASMSVTAQNVSHWFQNRRRKDTHPEIEQKRVKRSQTRRRAKTSPLDLTQPHQRSSAAAPANPVVTSAEDRESDDEPGLCIAEPGQSDTENESAPHQSINNQSY